MIHDPAAPGPRLLALWARFHSLPGGPLLFSFALRRMVPYTGTVRPRVVRLEPGASEVTMSDRRRVRNHLRSVHAVALTNLGELATGLATLTALPAGVRGIVVRLSTDYHAKARGRLTAECRVALPVELHDDDEIDATSRLRDAEGRHVATVTARWRLRSSR